MHDYAANMAFEDEVRRVAEAIWQLDPGTCQPSHYTHNPVVSEIDGMARLRDVTHLLMVTVSTKLEKIKGDVRKLKEAAKIEAHFGIVVSMWIVTKHQLNAEHISYAKAQGVTVITLDHFRNRFFDGRNYIQKRKIGAFGSARNLSDDSITFKDNEYIPLPMRLAEYGDSGLILREYGNVEISILENLLLEGKILIMTAPFGSGKSLTTRQIFLDLSKKLLENSINKIPVSINLREHWGQDYFDEILERHARSIGFLPKENITLAWRAGIITLLIDGFDEIASQVIARSDKLQFMRDARYQALQGIRDLMTKLPQGVGILICGRDHYFDDIKEMSHALGLGGKVFSIVELEEFTEDQAKHFLQKNNVLLPLPDWLPRKPLMLGYLAHKGLLERVLTIDSSQGFGHAWGEFLDMICIRESTHERAVMDPDTVRRILERLACNVRATASGTGPINERDLAEAYHAETQQSPGEGILMQLQRLPGLTPRDQDKGSRSFIDEDMLAALQGSALAKAILGDIQILGNIRWMSGLSTNGITMAGHLLHATQTDYTIAITAAIRILNEVKNPSGYEYQLAADMTMIAINMGRNTTTIDCRSIVLVGVAINIFDLEDIAIKNLEFNDCLFDEIIIDDNIASSSIVFRRCSIGRVIGSASSDDLPSSMFIECDIALFDDMKTNRAILNSNLPAPVKALLTILRKIYKRAVSGLRRGVFKTGLPNGPIHDSIDEVLHILENEELIGVRSGFVHPIRKQSARAKQILASPNTSNDIILQKVRKINR